MYINILFLFILICIMNISYIYALNFKTNKVTHNYNLHHKTKHNNRILNEENSRNNIILNSTQDNLYYFKIEIGTPGQSFSVLLDTGSNFFLVNNENCKGCISNNKYISDKSQTYNYTSKSININYISGDLTGFICSDFIKFTNNKNLLNLDFVLVNDSNINFGLDGIFGLSKNIKDINNNELSPINQLFEKNISNNNIFVLDFPNNNFFIGEKPSYLDLYYNISCKRKSIYNLNDYYWKCISKKIKLNSISFNSSENNIIFNSGINSMVFSLNYKDFFKNIISNNKLLSDAKCEIKLSQENEYIYIIICYNFDNLINKESDTYINFYKEDFMLIYLDDRKNRISFKLEDFYDKDLKSFKLYFTDLPDNTIITGIPLFEKYIIMLDNDNKEVVIYNPKKEIQCREGFNINILKLSIIIVIVSITLIIIYYVYNKKNHISLYKLIYQK